MPPAGEEPTGAYDFAPTLTERRRRPRRRRRAKALRPPRVLIRARNPCLFTRFRFRGLYVGFIRLPLWLGNFVRHRRQTIKLPEFGTGSQGNDLSASGAHPPAAGPGYPEAGPDDPRGRAPPASTEAPSSWREGHSHRQTPSSATPRARGCQPPDTTRGGCGTVTRQDTGFFPRAREKTASPVLSPGIPIRVWHLDSNCELTISG